MVRVVTQTLPCHPYPRNRGCIGSISIALRCILPPLPPPRFRMFLTAVPVYTCDRLPLSVSGSFFFHSPRRAPDPYPTFTAAVTAPRVLFPQAPALLPLLPLRLRFTFPLACGRGRQRGLAPPALACSCVQCMLCVQCREAPAVPFVSPAPVSDGVSAHSPHCRACGALPSCCASCVPLSSLSVFAHVPQTMHKPRQALTVCGDCTL